MSEHSSIEWTDATWNPVRGCTKVSPGCDRCYAERMTHRFPKTYPLGFALTLRPDALEHSPVVVDGTRNVGDGPNSIGRRVEQRHFARRALGGDDTITDA